ncbi:MAG: hypothetical protein IKA05_04480 [Clostridia bacterium]|nr:hypothetical protein [Clostridia bacterium]
MADKMLQQAEEPVTNEPELVSVTEEMLEELRATIAELEEKETLLTEKLCAAKEKGLIQQADRCRALLQKVVIQKRIKKDELQECEARKLADELDALAEELELEFDPDPLEEEREIGYNYRAKAKRVSLISRLVGFVGIFSCFVGSFIYLLLAQVETLNLPFEWMYLAITGVAAVIFLIVALLIGHSANNYRRLAEEKEEEIRLAEEELARQKQAELLASAHLNAMSEAYSKETEKDFAIAHPKKRLFGSVKVPEVPEAVKKNVHKIVPVATVCTAVVAAAALSSAKKRRAAERRSAAVRKEFFNWLG